MIIIICGKPGAGKTSLLACLATRAMTIDSREAVKKAISVINVLNDNGYHFNYPEEHVCYTNFYCSNHGIRWYAPRVSYDLDGVDFGLEDDEHITKNIFPSSSLFFMESQSFLDSRKSRFFRQSVSRAYENHRHWGLNIYLDAQRATLIDLNVREIAGEIIEVQKIKIKRKAGKIVECKWLTRIFDASSIYEKYLETGKCDGNFVTREYVFPGDIFKCYVSENNFALFLDGRADKMFSCEKHVKPEFSKDYIDKYCSVHSLNNLKNGGYWQKN